MIKYLRIQITWQEEGLPATLNNPILGYSNLLATRLNLQQVIANNIND
uniref:Uncharacterized protein n=1 Tax=viral metagenome TaxID=1070528 RepID=A0A6C0C7A0_9ZZZZ